jgi:hypothetical protein
MYDWIKVAQDGVQCRIVKNIDELLGVTKVRVFLG